MRDDYGTHHDVLAEAHHDLAGGLAACDDQGPMEEAGEDVDEAVDSTSNMFEDGPAEEMGEDIDEATDN